MGRLSRAEQQERNKARVLAAAREEFTEHGYREAKIDRIADRAELTRGAVYSNFPGKRALYFAVLAELAATTPAPAEPARVSVREAAGAVARAWMSRLPLSEGPVHLGAGLLPETAADQAVRLPFAQLLKLDAIVLGLALENLDPRGGRRVRLAESLLTTLHGAGQLAASAPGFVEPFTVVAACEALAGIDDTWPEPAYLPFIGPAIPCDDPWTPPPVTDALRETTGPPPADGLVAVLGLHRLEAVEEAARRAPGTDLTIALVTGSPAELKPLARLVLTELRDRLRHAAPPGAWPRVRLVLDGDELAAALGLTAVSDATEAAALVTGGRITARAEGRGACHAAASAWTGRV
ncbi:TetR/AcrR family transcriptional regulator [Phytomonospora endophytica]|uniref:AcrR family transcriptional regulator n=1 Tax=Phytomonospora endophytica TaxID=714109 RepID=A0A841FY96_9ACTN|nr:TetR/AcrR family transcriptional regulator [Phytomonospora endophytica]MBB6039713.1 AcrR family transcriptional regulator [Phytomonospora endophytica]GIG70951.1 TetR family transcriptional regulator [Phytomonospora endophytica]